MFRIEVYVDKDSIIEHAVNFLNSSVQFLYKWLTTEGEALGYILGYLHFMAFVLLIIGIVISHTIYPSFWLQLGIFCVLFLVWLQHIFLKVCVSIVAEKHLTKTISPFHEIIEGIFKISTSDFIDDYVLGETAVVGCLALELVSRYALYIKGWSELI
jgi:hypothetical protein